MTKQNLRTLTAKIKARANYSLAILGMGAVTRGSGRFLNIRTTPLCKKQTLAK